MNRILSFNPDSMQVGWGLFEDETLIENGTLFLKKKASAHVRLAEIQSFVLSQIFTYEPNQLSILVSPCEHQAKNYDEFMMAKGCILAESVKRGLSIFEHSMSVVKSRYGLKTSTSSEIFQETISIHHNLPTAVPINESIAIGLGGTQAQVNSSNKKSLPFKSARASNLHETWSVIANRRAYR